MKLYFIPLFFILTIGVFGQSKIPVYTFDQLEPLLNKQTDTLYLINFWATWCPPCVEEMPAIEAVYSDHKDKKFSLLLVSLDFPNHLNSRLIPFIEKHGLTAPVILLNDPDSNAWIDKVSEEWSGGIPATLIYYKNDRTFYEQPFDYEEISAIINQKLNAL